jgi:ABC-type lipoprotein release transport system permease subunit
VPAEEWWAVPSDPATAAATLRAAAPHGTAVLSRSEIEQQRLTNPVNAGMRAAMLLVTVAAVLLAAVGFAASTAALGRARRHDNAVLLALGCSPRRIRAGFLVERVLLVVVTMVVGVALGAVAAVAVVPLLVGGDGHQQVPSVLVTVPLLPLLWFVAAVTALLAVVGVLVVRHTVRDLGRELREGEAP